MQKRLTADAFARAIRRITITDKNAEIAKQHLVTGLPQVALVAKYGVTQQSISKAVRRVWRAHLDGAELPENMRRITVVLPDDKAQIALAWEREARKPQRGA